MKMNWSHSLGTLALLASVVTLGWAQDTAKPETPAQDAKEEKTAADALPKLNSLTIGYTKWQRSGDPARSNPVGIPANGLAITKLDLLNPFKPGRTYSTLDLVNLGKEDFYAGGKAIFSSLRTSIDASVRNLNYHDAGTVGTGLSHDRVTELNAITTLAPNVGVYFSYRKQAKSQEFTAPKDDRHSVTETYSAGLEGKMFGGNAGVNLSSKRFQDQTGFQPTTAYRRAEGNYSVDLSPQISVAGTMAYTKIEQNSLKDSGVRALGISTAIDLTDSTSLVIDMSKQEINLPNALNAYDRKRLQYSVRLNNHDQGWSSQVGFQHKESERMNSDHTFVDVPAWDIFEFRAGHKTDEGTRLTLRGSWKSLRRGFNLQTSDPTQMAWDDDGMAQVKIAGGSEKEQMYGAYTYRYKENTARNLNLTSHNFVAGISYTFNPKVLGYCEAGHDSYQSSSVFPSSTVPLTYYFKDGFSLAAGLNYVLNDKESYSASMNSYGNSNVYGRQLTFGYNRQLSPNNTLNILVSPWLHEDKLYGLTGTKNTAFSVQMKVKF